MPREPERKKEDTYEEKCARDRDFTLITLPRPMYGVILHLAFSPSVAVENIGRLIAAQKNFYPIAYVKGGGATLQRLSDLGDYSHTTLLMLSPQVWVLVYYDRPEFDGFRYIAQAAMGIDLSGYYTPGYGPGGEVDRITRSRSVREEIGEVKSAVEEQIES